MQSLWNERECKKNFMNKTVIITGASSGIGKACAERFAKESWQLVLTARRAEKLATIKKALESEYAAKVFTLTQDVRNENSGNDLVVFLKANNIQPDLLINNAGLAVGTSPLQEGIVDDWERMIDTNVKGLLYISRAVVPMMIEQQRGHIINIGSIAGKEVYGGGNVYCATKHAVDALTKAMRIDLLPHGIRVSQVAPGAAETEFSIVRFKGDEQRAKNVYKGIEPLMGSDIADAIWYVANTPSHVNINDLVIMCTNQANATTFYRNEN